MSLDVDVLASSPKLDTLGLNVLCSCLSLVRGLLFLGLYVCLSSVIRGLNACLVSSVHGLDESLASPDCVC